jgi:hypothetical protein
MPERLPRVEPRVARTLTPGQEELRRKLAASNGQPNKVGTLPMEVRDRVDWAVAFEVDRRKDVASTPATRLAAAISLAGRQALKDATILKLLDMTDAEVEQLFKDREYPLSQQQIEVADGLYAVCAVAWHESNGNGREARGRLTKRVSTLRSDPNDPSSPERSILEAIAEGDMGLVHSVMDYQLGDFNPEVNTRKNS